MKDQLYCIYFVFYHMTAVLLSLNITVAFIIDYLANRA
jgi:hypothetical protein